MSELWVGAIAATVAACIWAAWGPKVLLATVVTPIVVFGVIFLAAIHVEQQQPQQQVLSPVQQQVRQQREYEAEQYRAQQHAKYQAQQQAQSRVATFDDVPFDPNAFLKGVRK